LAKQPRQSPLILGAPETEDEMRVSTIAVLFSISLLAGCGHDPGTRAVTGGLIGAGAGAGISAVTGGRPATGALIGGGVGAVGGAVTH
jgi:osmotically inducible lipoprotein OsmB